MIDAAKPQDKEIAEKANLLQEKLLEFASKDFLAREKMILEMSNLMKVENGVVTQKTMEKLVDPEFQPKLQTAVEKALETSFVIGLDKEHEEVEINSWLKDYTAVVINIQGEILGATTKPEGPVYKVYGKNLLGYALRKAVARLHLELDKNITMRGGLNNEANQYYLGRLGLIFDEDIFLGEATTAVILPNQQPTAIFIGTAGCEPTEEYRESLAPKMITKVQKYRVNFAAGELDMHFAGYLSMYLEDSNLSPTAQEEPPVLRKIKRIH